MEGVMALMNGAAMLVSRRERVFIGPNLAAMSLVLPMMTMGSGATALPAHRRT